MEHDCVKEQDWGKIWAIMPNLVRHAEEGEKPGGTRDRILQLEISINNLKSSIWRAAVIGGVIGGLLSQLTPEVFNFIVKTIFAR